MRLAPLLFLVACGDPGEPNQTVEYRDTLDDGPDSGERGNVKISEILWSGSVDSEGDRDLTDVFIELRNEGNRPVNVSGWALEMDGTVVHTFRIPTLDEKIPVGGHIFFAAKDSGCFPEPDALIPDLFFPQDAFRVTLVDADEHLIEGAGNRTMPPYAGGYDLKVSRSMEKIELMFGGRGSEPHSWHHYTPQHPDARPNEQVEPNNLEVKEDCRERTLASPGFANSPDYSGAYAAGSLE
jgi:hypothetical protein